MHFKLGLLGIAHFIKSKKSIKSLSKKGQMPTNLFLCQLYQKCILNWDFHILTMSASCQERQPISYAKPKTALYPGQGPLKNRQNRCTRWVYSSSLNNCKMDWLFSNLFCLCLICLNLLLFSLKIYGICGHLQLVSWRYLNLPNWDAH